MAREKKKRLGLWITVGIISVVLLLLLGSLAFVEYSIKNLESSMEQRQQEVTEAFEARSQEIKDLTKLLKPKMSSHGEAFEKLEKAEKELEKAVGVKALSDANVEVDKAINNIFSIVENDEPHLQIAIGESGITEELDTARHRIVISSTNYNEVAEEYNTIIKGFPGEFMAGIFGHEDVDVFYIDDYKDLA